MRSLIILSSTIPVETFCNELVRYDGRKHFFQLSFVNAHCGRITSDELYDLVFRGKFDFSSSKEKL